MKTVALAAVVSTLAVLVMNPGTGRACRSLAEGGVPLGSPSADREGHDSDVEDTTEERLVSPVVARAARASIPGTERAEVLRLLAAYTDPEPERVQLAVLALANGNEEEIRRLVQAARTDYRDVLWWAEYPEDAPTGVSRRRMAQRYRALGVPVPATLQRAR